MVTADEKVEFTRVESMSGWAIADHFGCSYSGDSDPINHGGFFYDAREWDGNGYAPAVEFWWDDEHDCLVVQRGTIRRPDDMEGAFRCVGRESDSPDRENIHAQIDAARAYCGIEPDGTGYPDLLNYRLDDWAEWRIWRSVAGWLRGLGS